MRLAAAITLFACFGCGNEYSVHASFESEDLRAATSRVGVAVVQNCPAGFDGALRGVVREVEFALGEASSSLGQLDPGTYGLVARAWNEECELVAAACRPITVEANGDAALRVEMFGYTGELCDAGQGCSAGRCQGAGDAGGDAPMDVGTDTDIVDAGGRDVPVDVTADVLMDVPVDVPTDVPVDTPVPDAAGTTFCERHGTGAYACVDFETDLSDGGWVRVMEGSARFTNVGGEGVTGRAAEVMGGAGDFAHVINDTLGPHTGDGTMWARIKVRVPATSYAAVGFMNVFSFRESRAPFTNMPISLAGDNTVRYAHRVGDVGPAGMSTSRYPADDWFCIELEFDNAVDGTLNHYLNGLLEATADPRGAGFWDEVYLGTRSTQASQPSGVTYYLDDFVWSDTRVPCELE